MSTEQTVPEPIAAGGAAATGRPDDVDELEAEQGLTASEVAARVAAGDVNAIPPAPSRTTREILRANVFTRFNALMTILAAIVLAAGSPRDTLFFGVVIANTLIGIVQELRAKRTLDGLAVTTAPRARVVRDGAVQEIAVGEIVLDDVIDVRPGQQVVADAVCLTVHRLEVDESLLTGEADPVVKQPGDDLLSGSFIVSGHARARVDKVGKDAYAARLAEEARRFTLVSSELRRSVDRIITWVGWVIIPAAIALFISQRRSQPDWRDAAVSAIAGVVSMVPEGLVLLTSVAFAVGVMRLAKQRTLVQELPAIEVLARVDVVCLDKTGTITEGTLEVVEVRPVAACPNLAEGLAAVAAADPDPNPTQKALLQAYPTQPGWTVAGTVAFSSARKWSAANFDSQGTWILGAPEMVLAAGGYDGELQATVEREADAGRRVLVLAQCPDPLDGDCLPPDLVAVALVLLEDRLRPDAASTLAYFLEQGVTLKVISGDNPRTVAAVAGRAGLDTEGRVVDARTLPEDLPALADAVEAGTVFGRVSPHQKRAMVGALQSRGHVVAMTGDGVNDVLALKDADVGIAMASGSEATRAVAQLVLLDSSFAALPGVVAEGRRVINNIERVASLFLVKTMYSVWLAALIAIVVVPYPFLPRHLTLTSALTIGTPAFFLALAPNRDRVRKGFLRRVARFAVPSGTIIAGAVFTVYEIARRNHDLTLDQRRTAAALVLVGVALIVLIRIARPLTPWRLGLVAVMCAGFVLALALPPAQDFFQLELPTWGERVAAAVAIAVAIPALVLGDVIAKRIAERVTPEHAS